MSGTIDPRDLSTTIEGQGLPPADFDPRDRSTSVGSASPLTTSYDKVPSTEHGAGRIAIQEQSRLPPEAQLATPIQLPDVPEPLKRIGSAVAQGWQGFDPESDTQKEINQRTLYGRYFAHPLAQLGSVPFRALGAASAGTGQAAYEAGAAIDPRLGRDFYMLNRVLPALLPQASGPRAAVSPPVAPEVSQLPPKSVMERSMSRPIEGQTTLGRAIDLLRHDQLWNNPDTPGYLPPEIKPAFIPPGATIPPTSGAPASGVADPLLGRALGPVIPTRTTAPMSPGESPVLTPGTSSAAKQVASAYYDVANKNQGTLSPAWTDAWVDAVSGASHQTEAGQAVAGQNVVTGLVDRLQALKGKPMTLQAAQEVDEALGGLISKEYGIGGMSKEGSRLADLQRGFRERIENANAGDITGGTTGFDALAPARKAWSQARKMDDVERILERANMTQNPTTSVQTQVRALLTSRPKSRGWADDEIAALKDAADRGALGATLHLLGSRLIPLAAGAAGLGSGPAGALTNFMIAHGLGGLVRSGANALQAKRIQSALDTLNKSVPPMPPSAP